MKRLMLFLLLGIFMLSFASAIEWDNYYSYDESTRTASFKNGLTFGSSIAEIKLNTPLNMRVATGYNYVFELELWGDVEYSDFVRGVYVHDKRASFNQINRDIDLKYFNGYETKYKDVIGCIEDGFSKNGTKECAQSGVIDTIEYQAEVWDDLLPRDLKKNDHLIIRGYTNVEVNDSIEWYIDFFGAGKNTGYNTKGVKEWATWTANLNIDIFAYYTFDNTGDDSLGVNNISLGANFVPGLIEQGYGPDGSEGYDMGFGFDEIDGPTGNFSISFWLNRTVNTVGNQVVFRNHGATTPDTAEAGLLFAGNNKLSLSTDSVTTTESVNTTLNVWVNYLWTYDGTTHNIYRDGDSTPVITDISAFNPNTINIDLFQNTAGGDRLSVAEIDEMAFWSRVLTFAEIDQIYNNGDGITFNNETINVSLNDPLNNTQQNFLIEFNWTIIPFNLNITNWTLSVFFDNGTLLLNEINTTIDTDQNTVVLHNETISDGSYIWNVESCGTNTNDVCDLSENRTFSIDSIFPQINIEAPSGLLDFNIIGGLETLNVTFTDSNLDTCWFDYNGTNVTIEGCISGIKNSTTFILEQNNFNMTVYANDTAGNENSSFTSWNYFVLTNSQTFSINTTEGSTESFTLNYTGNQTPISASFIYNGSVTSADIDATNFPNVIVSESIVIPNVDTLSILPFFWNIVTLSSNVNTTSTNQTVSDLALDNCSTFTNTLFNLTVIDETTQIQLDGETQNVSVEVDVTLFTSDKSTIVLNFSTGFNGTNPVAICSQQSLFNGSNYILDATIRYSSLARAIEFYNIRDLTIDNSSQTQNITLFDILTSEATDFQITFKNSNFIVVENALIQVNRQYVSEGVFKTVELPITDSNGQAVVHLIQNDVVYNYIVTKDNVVIGTFNNLVAFCDDASIGQCFISLNAIEGTQEVFNPDGASGVSFTALVFNSTSRDLAITFSTNDGSVKTITMSAIKMDQIGNTTVCSTTVVTSSGTITCNVPASFGNETIIVDLLVDGQTSFISYFSADNPFDIGLDGYFILLFLVISTALMFTESKSMTIIGVILGLIGGGLLFLTKGGFLATGASMIWIIIMGIILIWKLNLEGQT